MGEIILLLIVAGISGIYLGQTFDYRMPKLENSGGPALFPKMVLIILIILVLIRVIVIIVHKDFKHFKFFELFKGSTGLFSISLIVMIFIMPYLGFIVTCFLFMTITSHALLYIKTKTFGGARKIIMREVFFLVFAVGLYLFFTKVLFVSLPTGILSGLPI